MAKETNGKEKDGGSAMAILLSALLALGAAAGVYYCYEEAQTAEAALARSKDEYKKMAGWKKAVEDFVRKNKGRQQPAVEANQDMMVYLDRKAREAQLPAGSITFSKAPSQGVGAWSETAYTATLTTKEPAKRSPVVDFLRKVEMERKNTKVRNLRLDYNGDDFKSATITISEFTPK